MLRVCVSSMVMGLCLIGLQENGHLESVERVLVAVIGSASCDERRGSAATVEVVSEAFACRRANGSSQGTLQRYRSLDLSGCDPNHEISGVAEGVGALNDSRFFGCERHGVNLVGYAVDSDALKALGQISD